MEVILLEQIPRLGTMGDVVKVKNGFARNFLLPQNKALRATEANHKYFESQRNEIEKRNLDAKGKAEKLKQTLEGKRLTVIRQASESGRLYGSVAPRDILAELVKLLSEKDVSLSQIILAKPIREVGVHKFAVRFHAEVEAEILMAVARSEDEAKAQFAAFEKDGITADTKPEAKADSKPDSKADSKTDTESEAKGGAKADSKDPAQGIGEDGGEDSGEEEAKAADSKGDSKGEAKSADSKGDSKGEAKAKPASKATPPKEATSADEETPAEATSPKATPAKAATPADAATPAKASASTPKTPSPPKPPSKP